MNHVSKKERKKKPPSSMKKWETLPVLEVSQNTNLDIMYSS
jgi:hypothetical protein